MKKRLTNFAGAMLAFSSLLLPACTPTSVAYPPPKSQVWYQDSAKNWCVDTKTKADWYSASEETNCDRPTATAKVNVIEVPTLHTDLGMISTFVTAITGGVAGGATAGAIP